MHEPFSTDYPQPDERPNSAGDGLQRTPSRQISRQIEQALLWTPHAGFPARPETHGQAALGMFLSDELPGFRGVDFAGIVAFEDLYGACKSPAPPVKQGWGSMVSSSLLTCKDRCNDDDGPIQGCWCDEQCMALKDCCDDFDKFCEGVNAEPIPPNPPDWLDQILKLAPAVALHDVVVAVKDQLLTEPDLEPTEAAKIAAFFGVAQLQVPSIQVPELAAKVRVFCGTLLKTPQFQMTGISRPTQKNSPTLALAGDGYQDRCKLWAPLVVQGKGLKATCSAASVQVSKVP
ncbi:MAG: hypothetical protein EXR77_13420 [Myxococcales bacterium]|nr:hypothetical protein [Myxococcales bacterium]